MNFFINLLSGIVLFLFIVAVFITIFYAFLDFFIWKKKEKKKIAIWWKENQKCFDDIEKALEINDLLIDEL